MPTSRIPSFTSSLRRISVNKETTYAEPLMLFCFDFELEWVGCYVVVSSRTSSLVLTSADVAAEKRKETKRCDSLGFYTLSYGIRSPKTIPLFLKRWNRWHLFPHRSGFGNRYRYEGRTFPNGIRVRYGEPNVNP